MTELYEGLVDAALEALVKNKVKVEKLQELTDKLNSYDIYDNTSYMSNHEKLLSELATLQDTAKTLASRDQFSSSNYDKDRKDVQTSIEEIKAAIQALNDQDIYDSTQYANDKAEIEEAISNTSKDVESRIEKAINSLPIPKDGKDGYNGMPGMPGAKGRDGKDGKSINGVDGIGIVDIKSTSSKLLIELTNGKVIDIKLPKAKSIPAGVTAMPTEVVVMRNLADTDIDNATDGQVLTKENGKWVGKTIVAGEGDAVALERRTEIETMFKVAQSSAFKEITYSETLPKNITNIDIYTNSGKGTKLFSKIIGYNNGNISTISIIDEVNGGTLNKVMAYVEGNISNVTSTYTEVI